MFFAGPLQVDAPDIHVILKHFKGQAISEPRNRRPGAGDSKIESPGNRALGYRKPPEPKVGSGPGGKYELTAIGQPSGTKVCHTGRLNLFLFAPRLVAFSRCNIHRLKLEKSGETREKIKVRPSGETAGATSPTSLLGGFVNSICSPVSVENKCKAQTRSPLFGVGQTIHFESGVQDKYGP